MRMVYFAAVREALGCDAENIDFPGSIDTVGQALDWMAQQSSRHADAFANRAKLRFALDQQMVKADALLGAAREFAIFPPVTGG
jgi:molybdopterin synthase sulfur carrier subunit